MSNIQVLSQTNFSDALAENEIVVVDFWASWCEPCKAFAPVFAQAAAQHPAKFFATVDIEEEKSLAQEFEIRSIPFVMIIKSQVIIYAESGALSLAELKGLLEQADSVQASELP